MASPEEMAQLRATVTNCSRKIELRDLAQSLRKDEPRRLLVDAKGIGKPQHFHNEEQGFRSRVRTVNNLVTSIFGKEFEAVLEWCLDQDEEISMEALEAKHGEPDGVSGPADKGDQLFRLLSSLTHGESEDIVIGSKSGHEAWRKLHKRWNPLTAGRERNILRAVLNPERVKSWDSVRAAIEQLDDLVRRASLIRRFSSSHLCSGRIRRHCC